MSLCSFNRDFMTPDLTEVEKLLQLIYPILRLRCSELIPVLKNPVGLIEWIENRIRSQL